MLRVATQTKLSPEQVIGKAVTFFGPDGLKLKLQVKPRQQPVLKMT